MTPASIAGELVEASVEAPERLLGKFAAAAE